MRFVPEWLRLAGLRAHRSRAVPLVPPEGTVVAARGVGILGQAVGKVSRDGIYPL